MITKADEGSIYRIYCHQCDKWTRGKVLEVNEGVVYFRCRAWYKRECNVVIMAMADRPHKLIKRVSDD